MDISEELEDTSDEDEGKNIIIFLINYFLVAKLLNSLHCLSIVQRM